MLGCINLTGVKVNDRTVLKVSAIRVENALFENFPSLISLRCDTGVFEPLFMFFYVFKDCKGTESTDCKVGHFKDECILVKLIGLFFFEILFNTIDFGLFIFVVFNIFENLSVEFSINGLKLILL
jgi:hypothetical protein